MDYENKIIISTEKYESLIEASVRNKTAIRQLATGATTIGVLLRILGASQDIVDIFEKGATRNEDKRDTDN